MSASKFMYPTLEAYYAADERRRRSEETDYGVHWRLHGWEYRWRVSYVRNTGEIYAVHQGAMIGRYSFWAVCHRTQWAVSGGIHCSTGPWTTY